MRADTIGAIVAHSWTIRFPAHRSAYKHILIEEYSKWTEAPLTLHPMASRMAYVQSRILRPNHDGAPASIIP